VVLLGSLWCYYWVAYGVITISTSVRGRPCCGDSLPVQSAGIYSVLSSVRKNVSL